MQKDPFQVGFLGVETDQLHLGLAQGGDRVARYMSDIAIHGTPDSVLDQIERLRGEMNLEYLLCAPLSHETFTLLTDSVLPRLG